MRFVIACLAACGLLVGSAAVAVPVVAADSGYTMAAEQQPPAPEFQIDVDIDEGGGGWYANPLWIAIGVIGLVVLVLVISMAARGGTTIVKE
jgi:hypothetical protein